MKLEEFLDDLQNTDWQLDGLLIVIEPFLSIIESQNIWYSYGFCYISCHSVQKSFVSGYRGKSELPMSMDEESKFFNDLLTTQLDELFAEKNIKSRYVIKPVVPFDLDEIERL